MRNTMTLLSAVLAASLRSSKQWKYALAGLE